MRNWFSADTHFGHANLIEYCNRPYRNVNEMNQKLIANFNRLVHPDDTVFFLGDFCFHNSPGGKSGEGLTTKAEDYIKALQGRWVFVKGKHDGNNGLKTCIEKVYINFGGYRICMVHNPAHADNTCKLNFCGHVHTKWRFKKLTEESDLINVGVDQWNYNPVTFETIFQQYSKWKKTGFVTG